MQAITDSAIKLLVGSGKKTLITLPRTRVIIGSRLWSISSTAQIIMLRLTKSPLSMKAGIPTAATAPMKPITGAHAPSALTSARVRMFGLKVPLIQPVKPVNTLS